MGWSGFGVGMGCSSGKNNSTNQENLRTLVSLASGEHIALLHYYILVLSWGTREYTSCTTSIYHVDIFPTENK